MTDRPPDDASTREEPREPSGSETIEELLFLCLERPESEWPTAIEELCAQHPASATAIRKGFERLKDLGLAETAPEPRDYPEALGDFQLLRRLGGGGMGVVYLAEQRSLQRRVALKLIRPEHLYFPKTRQRFQREVEAIARLKHRGIVSIHTVGEHGDIPYFAMEWVNGCTLATLLQDLHEKPPAELDGYEVYRVVWAHAHERPRTSDPPPFFTGGYVQVIFRIAYAIAEALDYAHSRGVVHRDLKPSNVMVTIDGRALLLDFGLAALEGASPLTREGTQLGSLPYMAPEHILAQERDPSPRSDVYGLGILLYQLLTLRLPYDAESTAEIQERILAANPERPRVRNPALPWEMETVCLTAMDRDPARRYASAGDLAEDCRAALELRPIRARRPGPWLVCKRWVQRHPTATAIVALLVIASIAIPMAYAFTQRAAALQQERLREVAEQERERAERGAYLANIVAATTSLEAGKPWTARERLEACPPARRRWEWNYLHERLDDSSRSFAVSDKRLWHIALHAPSDRVACVGEDGLLHVFDQGSGETLVNRDLGNAAPTRCAWDTSGAWLAIGFADGTLLWLDPRADAEPMRLTIDEGTIAALAFHPTLDRLAVGSSSGALTFVDLKTVPTLATRRVGKHAGRLNSLAFDERGERLFTAGYDGTVRVWNLAIPEPTATTLVQGDLWIEALALAPDAQQIAWLGIDARVRVLSLEEGDPGTHDERVSPTIDTTAVALGWTHRGDHVLVAHGTSITALDPRTLLPVRRFQGHGDLVSSLCPLPPGDAFLSAGGDGVVKTWEFERPRERLAVLRMSSSVGAVRTFDEGRRVLAGDYRGDLIVWDGRSALPLATWSENAGQIVGLAIEESQGIVFVARSTGVIERRSLNDGAVLARSVVDASPLTLAYDPVHAHLIVGTQQGRLLGLDDQSLEVRIDIQAHEDLISNVQRHASGRWFLSAGYDGFLRTWDPTTFGRLTEIPTSSPRMHALAFDRTGRMLVAGGTDGVIERFVVDAEGSLTFRDTYRPANGRIQHLAFDATGTRLFIATPRQREIEVWDVEAGQRLMALTGPGRPVLTFELSDDGEVLYAGDMSRGLRAWHR